MQARAETTRLLRLLLRPRRTCNVQAKPRTDLVFPLCLARVVPVFCFGSLFSFAGVDRHLYSLKNIAAWKQKRLGDIQYNYPTFFTDPAYSRLTTSVLSTSNVSAPVFTLFGFGPVCAQGLGLAYNVEDDRLWINVSSWSGQADAYASSLKAALDEMKSVIEAK
jgi:hypothetical protein